MSAIPVHSARRTKTYLAAELADADGIKTSFATSTSPVALTVADWNGAAITAAGLLDLPRTVTITRSNNANQFSVAPIVITGLRGRGTVTESLTPANDDGNDVLRGTQPFDFVTGIAIPAQAGTGGTFLIGVQDICAPSGQTFHGVKLRGTDGQLNVQYGGDAGGSTDSFAAVSNTLEPIAAKRILTSPALAAPTDKALTVFLP